MRRKKEIAQLPSRAKIAALILFVSVILAVPTIISMFIGTHTIIEDVDCAKCHSDILTEQQASTVGYHKSADCSSCHASGSDIHGYTLPTEFGAMSAKCGECHGDEYADWLAGGHSDVAECWHCHTAWDGTPRP